MKLISGFFKFIAILLMIFVVIALPFSLLARNIGKVLFSPQIVVELLKENVLDSDIMANVAEYVVSSTGFVDQAKNENNPVSNLTFESLRSLSHTEWVAFFDLIAPQELISQSFSQFVMGYYEWIDNASPMPKFQVDIRPWKSNAITNTIPVMELVLHALPQCSPDQIETYHQFMDIGEGMDVPLCRPPEPIYSELLDMGATAIPAQIANYPDQIDFGGSFAENNNNDMSGAKSALQSLRVFMNVFWIVVVVIFILALPMGARSIPSFFRWAGWPLMIAGIFSLLITLVFLFFSEGIMAGLSSLLFVGFPRPALIPLEALTHSILDYLSRPMLIQSATLIVIGGGALIAAVVTGSKAEQAIPATPIPVVEPKLGDTKPNPVVKDEADDDSRPSGMFG